MQAWARASLAGWLGVLAALLLTAGPARAEDWLPIVPEELSMPQVPGAPSAPAVYLYRQVDREDDAYVEKVYQRLKILNEEGRKYGDIEIRYHKDYESIRGVEARTIRTDGSVVNFTGTVFEKPIAATHGVSLVAKTFTLPDVQPGCIIEYRYRHELPRGWAFSSQWILSSNLYTRSAKFSLTPNPRFSLRWSWPNGLPEGTAPPVREGHVIRLQTHDVPAFVSEENMPPENELRYRVDFIYEAERTPEKDPVVFWKNLGKKAYRDIEHFSDRRSAMTAALAQITQPGDTAEAKLRKIYARTQQVRNLSLERTRSAQERERDPGNASNVEDIWKANAGEGYQITWLFLALARAAGLTADPVLVSSRDMYFFDARIMNPATLNSNLVIVNLDGKELYFGPAVPFMPFGQLPWAETGCLSLRLDANGGSWIKTPVPDASVSRIERKAILKFDSGSLEGKVTVTYTGLEASWRRFAERNEDDTERRQYLEHEMERVVPTGIEVKLTNSPDWASSADTLIAEYELQVPGWASGAGRRELLPVGLFSNEERHKFEHGNRIHPIYFDFPYQHRDDIAIELAGGWQVERVPEAHNLDLKGVVYHATAQHEQQSVHLTRDLSINVFLTKAETYPSLQKFFQTVRTGDEEQVVIAPAAAH